MTATPAQIGFITQEFRTVESSDSSAATKYGDAARKSEQPIETFFEVVADAQSMCDERKTLLAADRRRFTMTVSGESTGLGMAYTSSTPAVTVIDDERQANMPALVSEITIDFDAEQTRLETWG